MESTIEFLIYFLLAILAIYYIFHFFYYLFHKKIVRDENIKKETILFIKYNIADKSILISSVDSLDIELGQKIKSVISQDYFEKRIEKFLSNEEDEEFTVKSEDEKNYLTLSFLFKNFDQENKNINIRCIYKNDYTNINKYFLNDIESMKIHINKKRKNSFYYINIIDFNLINKRYGQVSGDYILNILKKRIQNFQSKKVLTSYIGSDHFSILNSKIKNEKKAYKYSKKIIKKMSESVDINGIIIDLNINIGAVIGKFDNLEDYIHYSYIACEHCKETQEKIIIYDNRLKLEENNSIVCKNELNSVIEKQSFNLKYGPVYSFNKSRIIGYVGEPLFIYNDVTLDKIRFFASQIGFFD